MEAFMDKRKIAFLGDFPLPVFIRKELQLRMTRLLANFAKLTRIVPVKIM